MKITEVSRAEKKETPHRVDVRPLFSSEHADIVHILLGPGESLKRHVTPVDALFYVLEGNPTVEIGDERTVVGPDTMVESPARIPHSISNPTDARARILVMKVPRPTETSRVL